MKIVKNNKIVASFLVQRVKITIINEVFCLRFFSVPAMAVRFVVNTANPAVNQSHSDWKMELIPIP